VFGAYRSKCLCESDPKNTSLYVRFFLKIRVSGTLRYRRKLTQNLAHVMREKTEVYQCSNLQGRRVLSLWREEPGLSKDLGGQHYRMK